MDKSTIEQIRARFDADVERFSDLATGQAATMDAPLAMDLVTRAAAETPRTVSRVLDIGCGAGNYSLKVLDHCPGARFTLVDLSRPMLDRATRRITEAGGVVEQCIQDDIRAVDLGEQCFDAAMAAAVLHHLRAETEWHAVFTAVFRTLRPGGGLWIFDFINHRNPVVQQMMWERFGRHLLDLGGPEYRDKVLAYIEAEDTPRPLTFQLEAMRRAGFIALDVLHKNACFAAFGGRRPDAAASGDEQDIGVQLEVTPS